MTVEEAEHGVETTIGIDEHEVDVLKTRARQLNTACR